MHTIFVRTKWHSVQQKELFTRKKPPFAHLANEILKFVENRFSRRESEDIYLAFELNTEAFLHVVEH